MIHLGGIVEAQYKNGQKHGYCRSVGSDGSYREEYYLNGKLNGVQTLFNSIGDVLSVREYHDNKEVGTTLQDYDG